MRNTRYLVALVLLWTASVAAQDAPASAADPRHAQSRELATALQQALGSRLMAALGSGGPVAAIEVCHVEAPAIAAGLSASAAARVGRTTLKVRNPDNAPDQAAREVLERFERQWEGRGATPPEDYTVAADGSARYLRGIVTQQLCLVCHGSELAPDVAAAIRARYPDDAATGYALGTLRGAFLIEWPPR
jgi:hypothetical protein